MERTHLNRIELSGKVQFAKITEVNGSKFVRFSIEQFYGAGEGCTTQTFPCIYWMKGNESESMFESGNWVYVRGMLSYTTYQTENGAGRYYDIRVAEIR
jgi:hypothetical protein